MFSHLETIRVPRDRRNAIETVLRGPHHLTEVVLMGDRGLQTEVREALTGIVRVGRASEYRRERDLRVRYRFRTVDGKPLGAFRVGLVEGTSAELDHMARLGESMDRTIDLGAEFEVDADLGLGLLDRLGWGIVTPRYFRRNAAVMGVVDSRGRPVLPYDRWRVVEVGSRMDAKARAEYDAAAAAEEPPQGGDSEGEPRRRGRPPKARDSALAEV